MRLSAPCGNDLLAHFFGERDIHQMVAVNMPDLAFANHIFHAAAPVLANGARESMRLRSYPCPGGNRFRDACLCTLNTHSGLRPLPNFLHNSSRVSCSFADRMLNSSTNAAT